MSSGRISAKETLLSLLPSLISEQPNVPLSSLSHSLITRFIFIPSSGQAELGVHTWTQPTPDLGHLAALPFEDLVPEDISVVYQVKDAETAIARVPLSSFWAVFHLEGAVPGEWKWFDLTKRDDDMNEEEDDWFESLELAAEKFKAVHEANHEEEEDAKAYWGPSDDDEPKKEGAKHNLSRSHPHRTQTDLDKLVNARIGVDAHTSAGPSEGRAGVSDDAGRLTLSTPNTPRRNMRRLSSTETRKASDTGHDVLEDDEEKTSPVPIPSMPIPIPIPAAHTHQDATYTPTSDLTDNSERKGKFIRRDFEPSDVHKPPVITTEKDDQEALLHVPAEKPLRIVKRSSTDIHAMRSPVPLVRTLDDDTRRFTDNDIAAINAVQGIHKLWMAASGQDVDVEKVNFYRIVQAAMQD